MNKKNTLEYVKNYFKEHGCELLEEEYKNNKAKMKYKCVCGDINKINFHNFQHGKRCRKCANDKLRIDRQFSYEEVEKMFLSNGCKLLEKEYINNRTPMSYKCSCGNVSKIRFGCFKQGGRCEKCAHKRTTDITRYSFKYVCDFFKKNHCKLLEKEYKNCDTKMKYKCNCGNLSKINFDSFKRGTRCLKCAGLKDLEKIMAIIIQT